MNVRDWPLDRIMQLPDCAFGRRWPVISSRRLDEPALDQWLVSAPLPNTCVLWSINVWGFYSDDSTSWMKFAIGDHAPANDVEFDAFERLFPGDLDNIFQEGAIVPPHRGICHLPCRKPIQTAGGRFVIQYNHGSGTAEHLTFAFEISSIPTEVPDWLINSGPGRSL